MNRRIRSSWWWFLLLSVPAARAGELDGADFYDLGLFAVSELLATPDALLAGDPEQLFLLGSAELAQGDPAQATHYLELANLTHPTHRHLEESHLAVGRSQMALGRFARASASFRASSRLATSGEARRLAMWGLAQSLYAMGDYRSALHAWEELEAEAEELDRRFYLAKAETQIQLEELDGAAESLERAGELCDENARRGEIHYWHGRVLTARGRYPEAVAAYNLAVREEPREQGAPALFERGLVLFRLGEYDEAADSLREALSCSSLPEEDVPDASFFLALSSYNCGEYSTAQALAGVLTEDPRRGNVARRLQAEAAYAGGDYALGARCFDLLALTDPAVAAEAVFKAGLCYFRLQDFAQAEVRFTATATTAGDSPADYWYGMAVLRQRRWTEARGILNAVAAGDGSLADNALYELGRLESRTGDTRAALECYGRLLELYPSSDLGALALYDRSQLLINAGRHAEGLADLQRLADDYPADELADDALYLLADSAYENGRFAEALPVLERLTTGYPDSGYRDYARLRIADCRYGLAEYSSAAELYDRLARESRLTQVQDESAYGSVLCGWKTGRYPDVVAATEAYLARRPGSILAPELLLMLGRHYSSSGDPRRAAEEYCSLLRDFAASAEAVEAAADLARLYRDQGRAGEALTLLRQAYDQLPAGASRASLALEVAELARKERDYNLAISYYNLLLQECPGHPRAAEALLGLAECYRDLRQTSAARQTLERLEQLAPGGVLADRAALLRGFIEQSDGREATAVKYYQLAAASGDESVAVQAGFWLAECWLGVGELDSALIAFQDVIDRHGERYPAYAARSLLRRGQIYERRRQPVAARRQYTLVLQGTYPQEYRRQAEERLEELR